MGDDLAIQTIARNFATKLVLAGLGWFGGFIVAHGWATDGVVQQAIPSVAQIIVGALTTIGAGALAWYRARRKRSREMSLRVADPATVAVK